MNYLLPLAGPGDDYRRDLAALALRVGLYTSLSYVAAQFLKTKAAEVIFEGNLTFFATYPRQMAIGCGFLTLLGFEAAVQRAARDAAFSRGKKEVAKEEVRYAAELF